MKVNGELYTVPEPGVHVVTTSTGPYPLLAWWDNGCIQILGASKIMVSKGVKYSLYQEMQPCLLGMKSYWKATLLSDTINSTLKDAEMFACRDTTMVTKFHEASQD